MFFLVAAPICITINSVGGFPSLDFLHPFQHLLLVDFLMMVMPTSVRRCLTIILICISLMISSAEHLFMYLLTICVSFGECLFKSFAQFLIRLFVLWMLSYMSCLYILETTHLLVTQFPNISYHSVGCLFTLFFVSFAGPKLLNFTGSHLFISAFICITLGDKSKKHVVVIYVLLTFSCKTFIVSIFILWQLF